MVQLLKTELNMGIFLKIGNKSISENATATTASKMPESTPVSAPVPSPE
jgi:hypothetical protein